MIGIGDVINGKYRLIRLLGEGGMGAVYEAQHEVLGTRVAIKVLHPELLRRTGLVERFLQEARVAAQIRSPHVVQVTDIDRTTDGNAYIVMELLEGEPLSAVLDRQRRLPITTACEYTVQILEALEAAHAIGVIHRDLKPENVFVTFVAGKSVIKIIDFGIAKARRSDPNQKSLTVAGVIMGTAEYMAPEQARSADKVDARSDLYAVGVMLYEMIAGQRPVLGEDARIVALKVERGEVEPLVKVFPDVPRELAGLVHRAMAARPELRFASAAEMRLGLLDALQAKRPAVAVTGAMAVPRALAPPAGEAAVGVEPVRARTDVGAPLDGPRGTRIEPAGPGDEPKVDTQRVPPVGGAPMGAPAYAVGMTPPHGAGGAMGPVRIPMHMGGAPHRPKKSGAGLLLALIAVPLVLGAGIVAIVVATGSGGTRPAPFPLSTSTTATTPVAKADSDAAAPVAPGDPLPELSTGPSTPTTPAGPGPGPRPPGTLPSALPSAVPSGSSSPTPPRADAGPAPFVIPSTLPTVIPSTLPPFPFPFPAPSHNVAPTPPGSPI